MQNESSISSYHLEPRFTDWIPSRCAIARMIQHCKPNIKHRSCCSCYCCRSIPIYSSLFTINTVSVTMQQTQTISKQGNYTKIAIAMCFFVLTHFHFVLFVVIFSFQFKIIKQYFIALSIIYIMSSRTKTTNIFSNHHL